MLLKDLYNNHKIMSEIVILATGYKQLLNKSIFNLALYIMNGRKHSFGVSDPNLSLSAIRANKIISVIKNKEGK